MMRQGGEGQLPPRPLSAAAEQVHGAEENFASLQPFSLLPAPCRQSWPGKHIRQTKFIDLFIDYVTFWLQHGS